MTRDANDRRSINKSAGPAAIAERSSSTSGNSDAVVAVPGESDTHGLRAVTRTLDLLDAIAASNGRLDLATLARSSGLHPATALRYLASLQARGFIRHNPDTGYQLGPKLFELGSAFVGRISIAQEIQGPLEELALAAQETASAGVVDGDSVLYIAIVRGQRELGIQSSPGTRHPLHCTSLGKAMLAHLPWREAEALLRSRQLTALTQHTIVHLSELRREFEDVRRRGYAVDDEERHEGVYCIGAPIFDHSGSVVGALSVSGPKFRMVRSQAESAKLVVQVTATVSKRLGAPRG